MKLLITQASDYEPKKHTNIENWYALAASILGKLTPDKAMMRFGIGTQGKNRGERK